VNDRTRFTEEQIQARMAEIVALGMRLRGASLAERLGGSEELPLQGIDWQHAANDWRIWGRPKQLVVADPELPDWWPGERIRWRIALMLAGRGLGKTRTGAETTWHRIEHGHARSLLLIGPTWQDVRRTMVGGLANTDSGLLDVIPPHVRKHTEYNKNDKEIHVRPYGATVYLATAEDPEQRGGNFDWVWGDEPIKWRRLTTVLHNLSLALRDPRGACQLFLTTTPKRQQWLIDMLMDLRVLVLHGITDENASNIHPDALADWRRQYAGTRVGKQELDALLLGDNDSAIATSAQIEAGRIEELPKLVDVGVGIDPAVSTKRRSDDSGIVVAGKTMGGELVAIDDRSGRYEAADHGSAKGWPEEAVRAAKAFGAKWVIYEENKIGNTGIALLRTAIAAAGMSGKIGMRTAYSFKDKRTRALGVQRLYDQGKVFHYGRHPELETQLTQWDAEDETQASPNNLDAYVHVANELMGLADIDEKPDRVRTGRGMIEVNRRFEVDRSRL
jgi:phage terminase large subunit-like protein